MLIVRDLGYVQNVGLLILGFTSFLAISSFFVKMLDERCDYLAEKFMHLENPNWKNSHSGYIGRFLVKSLIAILVFANITFATYYLIRVEMKEDIQEVVEYYQEVKADRNKLLKYTRHCTPYELMEFNHKIDKANAGISELRIIRDFEGNKGLMGSSLKKLLNEWVPLEHMSIEESYYD